MKPVAMLAAPPVKLTAAQTDALRYVLATGWTAHETHVRFHLIANGHDVKCATPMLLALERRGLIVQTAPHWFNATKDAKDWMRHLAGKVEQ